MPLTRLLAVRSIVHAANLPSRDPGTWMGMTTAIWTPDAWRGALRLFAYQEFAVPSFRISQTAGDI